MLTAGVIRPFLKAHTSGKSLKLLLAQIDAGRARELDLWNVKISFPSRDSGEYFAMSTTGTDSDLHPSCVNDGAEAALLIVAEPVGTYEDDTATTPSSYYLSGSYPDGTPDSQQSHDYYPCFGGQAHGQGAPCILAGATGARKSNLHLQMYLNNPVTRLDLNRYGGRLEIILT
jgi:hypothetical protein